MMKWKYVLLGLLPLITASIPDRSHYRPGWQRNPTLVKMHEKYNEENVLNGSRIVGGTEVIPHSFPHQVAMFIDGSFFCGGSLISENIVITAAHCMYGAYSVIMYMASHDIIHGNDAEVERTSKDFAVHEDYDPMTLTNDIAYIRFHPIEFNADIQPIQLSDSDGSDPTTGQIAKAIGWGKDADDADWISTVLREVDIPIMDHLDCNAAYGAVPDNTICTDGSGGKGVCGGDSGGPLIYNGIQVGLTSFGATAGCEIGYPSGFTRISHFRDWILTNTGV